VAIELAEQQIAQGYALARGAQPGRLQHLDDCALGSLLAPFSEAGVSMTRLESRPARHTLWEYVFFVDLEGHREDAPVRSALAELGRRAPYLKLLGSYPVAAY